MGKTLKIFIALQLVISVVALSLGTILFLQRDVRKLSTQNLESGAQSFADSIRVEDFRKSRLVVKTKEGFPAQRKTLQELAVQGQDQWQLLQDTIQELEDTRRDLAETQEILRTTQGKLEDALDRVARLTEDLNRTEAELAQANNQIADLNGEVADLNADLTALKDDYAGLEEERDDLQVNYDGCEQELNVCLGPAPTDATGRVLLINQSWNFVVIDIGAEDNVAAKEVMLIHRGAEYIGRVRISEVEPTVCLAEILPGTDAEKIQPGDHVISPEG